MTLEFSLSPEQEEIRKLAHQFAEREIRPVAAQYDEGASSPTRTVKKAHRLGLSPAAFIPEQYGGQGLDFLTELILNEELELGLRRDRRAHPVHGARRRGHQGERHRGAEQRWLPDSPTPTA